MKLARTSLIAVLPMVALVACTASSEEDTDSAESAQNASVCGNGVREPGEQCDDANKSNLDGCSESCQFEQVHRMNSLEMMFTTDSFCTSNALGGAIKGVAQGQLQDVVSGAVADGSISMLSLFSGLDDLTGQGTESFTLGSLIGQPQPAGGVDAWYSPNPISITQEREPVSTLTASIQGGTLQAGPGNVAFSLSLGATPMNGRLSRARLRAQLGAATTPTASTGASPGHLASQKLDPALKSFATMSNGVPCGNIGAITLASVPVPSELQSGGGTACSQGYTSANTMLDLFVGGCKVLFFTALGATQPDKADSSVPVVGAGAPYKLTAGSDKRVNGCKDKNGAAVSLDACLQSAAYSTAFKFTSQRAIVR